VIGAFLAIRRRVFESVGGFDQRYFMYYEEVDLCLRCREAGWGAYHLDDGDVIHFGNVSSRQIRGKRLFYSLRSRHQYAERHWSRRKQRALLLTEFGIELPARMGAEILQSRSFWPKETIEGYRMYSRGLRQPEQERGSA
jgi:GT2 family glycosyltransferase